MEEATKGNCSLLRSLRCLGAYPCPSQARLSLPGEEEQPGAAGAMAGVRLEAHAWGGSRKSWDADV